MNKILTPPPRDKIVWLVAVGFLLIAVIIWLNEICDLSRVLLGTSATPLNLGEAAIESFFVLVVGFLTVSVMANYSIKRNLAEEKVRRQDKGLELFRLAVDNVSNHITITDADGSILYANRAAEDLTGYSVSEMMGKKAGGSGLWGGLQDKGYYLRMWDTIKNKKQPYYGEMTNRKKNGERYDAEVFISPILGQGGEILFFVGIERDITERKEADRVKAEFVTTVAHQIRTPLTSISMAVELLLRGSDGDLSGGQTNTLRDIFQDVKSLADLVGALLNVSRIEMGVFKPCPEPIDPAGIAEDVIGEMAPHAAAKEVTIERRYGKRWPTVPTDKNIFRIVLHNLLSNAVKYSRRGGSVFLTMEKKADAIFVRVDDKGVGIPAAEQEKVFTKFFRASNIVRRDFSGIGIGLYLIKSFLEKAGGKVWFESRENEGSSFFASIPVKEQTSGQISATARDRE